jgi:hypothetical protein
MKYKILEIRDSMTFISVLAVRMESIDPKEAYYLWREGYVPGSNIVMLTRLTDCDTRNNPYHWDAPHYGRTMKIAHDYIVKHYAELQTGDVVDVQYILGETASVKKSERREIT